MNLPACDIYSEQPEYPEAKGDRVVIAFVNNMPDAAVRSAERQFRALLQAETAGFEIILKHFYLPAVPRTDVARMTFMQHYRDIGELWDSEIDGLIVTGAEPRAERLEDEPYWSMLSQLADWAESNTTSAIWSCLAAHAAAYRLSGITRRRFDKKLSGLFECHKALEHPLTVDLPPSWAMPQSRYNDLPQAELLDSGFEPLITLKTGFDTFIKQKKSLFVFFQGHPEYEPESLLLEYIRDVRRFIEGKRESYPDAPVGYFDSETLEKLEELRNRALQERNQDCFTAVTRLLQGREVENLWRNPSSIIYRNWVSYLAKQKLSRQVQ